MTLTVDAAFQVRLRDDPIRLFRDLARTHGSVVHFTLRGRAVFLVSDPALIHEVLVSRQADFGKHQVRDRALSLLGNGLMTSDDATNRAQRRHMSPLFGHARLQRCIPVMAEEAVRWCDRQPPAADFDMVEGMGALTLTIAARCLLDVDLEHEVETIRGALLDCLDAVAHPDPEPRIQQGRRRLDAVVDPLIEARRASPGGHDLISLLLAANVAPQLIRDEIITMLLGAHETTASALAWTWWLLDRHPEPQQRFRDEIRTGQAPELPFTRAVIAESLRLHSPGWIIGRTALQPTEVGGHPISTGAVVLMSPAVVHHDPALYPEPERFDPTRFLDSESRPRWAYFPFGGGARTCIGEQFAWLEMLVVLSVVGRRYRFRADPHHPIEEQALAAMRPRWGIRGTLWPA